MLISRRRKIDLSKHRKKAIIHWQWLVCVCVLTSIFLAIQMNSIEVAFETELEISVNRSEKCQLKNSICEQKIEQKNQN